MTELTAAHFEEVCASGPVQSQIQAIEATRSAAVKQFWMFLIGGIVVTLVATVVGMGIHSFAGGVAFIGGIIGTLIFCMRPLDKAKRSLKDPMLTALAERGGMAYYAAGFEPPFYLEARKALFGNWLSGQTFTDLFTGKTPDGHAFGIYEATLEQGSGKNRQTIFQGQMYGFETGQAPSGVTVLTPDRGLFNFFKPGPGMERVKFEDDPAFEKKFELYSTEPAKAQALFGSPTLRQRLLELRAKGKLFAYLDGQSAFFAITGGDRFEPGSMFKSMTGQQRAKLMFDDVCGSLTILRELKAAFGGSSRWERDVA